MEYNTIYGSLVSKKSSYSIDGIPLVSGISCLLKQMHVSVTYKLMSYLGQYVRSKIHQIFPENDNITVGWDDGLQIPELASSIIIFLEQLCWFSPMHLRERSSVHFLLLFYSKYDRKIDRMILTKNSIS